MPRTSSICRVRRSTFVALARGMGVDGTRAETAEEFVTALEHALAEPGPHLIDAIIPARL